MKLARKKGYDTRVCAVKFCRASCDRNFFKFPNDVEKCKLWARLCGCQYLLQSTISLPTSGFRVCSLHFEKEMLTKSARKVPKCPRLIADAVPTLNLPEMEKNVYTLDHSYSIFSVAKKCEATSPSLTTSIPEVTEVKLDDFDETEGYIAIKLEDDENSMSKYRIKIENEETEDDIETREKNNEESKYIRVKMENEEIENVIETRGENYEEYIPSTSKFMQIKIKAEVENLDENNPTSLKFFEFKSEYF